MKRKRVRLLATGMVLVLAVGSSLVVTGPATAAGRTCQGFRATLVGTDKADTLTGTPGRDVILGLGGDDDISGLGGADVICGGPGQDVLRGGGGRDVLIGGGDEDLIVGGAGSDVAIGGGRPDLCHQVERAFRCRKARAGRITVSALSHTSAPATALRGFAPPRATVVVLGGLAPAKAVADADGVFRADVILLPGKRNDLQAVVRASGSTKQLSAKVTVWQRGGTATQQVSGRIVDPEGHGVAGAKVAYAGRSAVSAADGRYRLTGLPAGLVALRATKAGHLGGLSTVDTTGGQPVDILVQPIAAPVTLTSAGGTFQGAGYRIVVPRDAVARPTPLSITALVLSGTKDDYGLPVVDLSPSGLTFRRPITVELDPGVVGVAARDAGVVGLNPDTGRLTPLASRIVGGKLQVSLRTLDGMELRLPFDPAALGTPCTRYNPIAAVAVRDFYRGVLPPFLLARMGLDASLLWGRYLAGGRASTQRRTLTSFGQDAFRTSRFTVDARAGVAQDLGRALLGSATLPALRPPATPAEQQVKDFGVGQNLQINYAEVYSVPGNLAGGVGVSSPALGSVRDSRAIDGTITFTPEATDRGVLTRVSAKAGFKLTVLDSVDLCPGDVGASIEQFATIPLSRLEVTPIPILGGTFATPQLFIADPDLEPETYDVTRRYPGNDQDSDGVPDRQPWTGGTYRLDNCPAIANPDQADSDGDGVGDACDDSDDPEPDPGPRPPGAGSSFGDPHLLTFDSLAYDFQATGDYVAVTDPVDGFEIQYRFSRQTGGSPAISFNRGAAARVGDSVIAFGDDASTTPGAEMAATLDGRPLTVGTAPTELPGGATVRLIGSDRLVRWPDGTELRVGPRAAYSTVAVTVAPARYGRVAGLLGNADRDPRNDLTARDGTVVQDVRDRAQLYDGFGASWRATGTASLFRTPLPNLIGLPVLPSSITSISELSAEARAEAERICRDRGLQAGAGLEQCILDVGITGDPAFADLAAQLATRMLTVVDASALNPQVETTSAVTIGQRATGSLDTPFAVDVFTVNLTAGDGIRVESGGSCPSVGTFSVTLVSPTGRVITRTRGSECGSLGVSNVRESGVYQLRVQDTGGFTGAYAFTVSGTGLGLTCQANEVGPNDDGSSEEVSLPFSLDFDGRTFSTLWVNNNGNVTFDGPLSAYTPQDLSTFGRPIAAVWWADVDTRGTDNGQVRYGLGEVDGRRAFCVDSRDVGYYGGSDSKRNSFQLYLVDRSDVAAGAFDIVYRYTKLQWETGSASGGTGGLGGTSAAVGYTNGAGSVRELAGSRVPGSFLDTAPGSLVNTSTSTDEPGVHVFPIRRTR
ncbi:nidogen-like domain-containing protein [Micromonospora lutea]|uniref:VWFD domain-containing protein n=1 Tax=Micromonospora lutea TaxID=419825 RepID=A0ABQ4J1C7_9ACTN|nr:nidogen-like domain-containing protein [Micromonospora lutea]GIJ23944.1 hypothetical protein Vlu01_45680 [Micromonospora lutea]